MENAPIIPETIDDDKEDDSKSKKKSRKGYGLGNFAFELDKSEKDDKKEKSWFDFLEKKEDKKESKGEKSDKDKTAENNETDKKPKDGDGLETEKVVSENTAEHSKDNLEAEAPIEEISEIEAAEIRPKIIEAIETVEKDSESDPDTDAPVAEFRDLVKETGNADAAYEQVLSDLGSDPEEVENLTIESEAEEAPDFTEDESEELLETGSEDERLFGEDIDDEMHEDEEILLNPPENDAEPASDIATEEDDSGQQNNNSSTSGGGSTQPPVPPAPPFGPYGAGGAPPQGPNLNVSPTFAAANPNTAPASQEPEYYYGASPAAMALFGGIIGYLIGRRRGRIKTERRLLPVQKKLEKQVEDLRFDIQEKEKAIRRIAAEKIKTEGPAIIERFNKSERESAEKPSRIKAPEATELHGPNKRHERIGHVIVTKETVREARPQVEISKKAEKNEIDQEQNKLEINRDVESFSRNELLEIGDKISINGTTLRQIYNSHLIGERGLRRLIHEHMRGGDLSKALKLEISERELDFERDPLLRDMAPHNYSGSGGSPAAGGQAALQHLLKKADAALEDTSEEAAYYKARAAFESKQYEQKQKNRQLLDISLAIVITSLLSVIIYLIITKG